MNTRSYDYVIIGGGSAGCVLAARLTEDRNVSVALLEAGDADKAQEISTPIAWPGLAKTKFDWDFASEPEPALNGRGVYIARGKTLGGSSAVNAMIYMRGNPMDYDGWAKEGAPGWSYEEILPYFIKSESNQRGDERFHGRSGPLSVQDGRYKHPLVDRFVEAGIQAGHEHNDDSMEPASSASGVRLSRPSSRRSPVRSRMARSWKRSAVAIWPPTKCRASGASFRSFHRLPPASCKSSCCANKSCRADTLPAAAAPDRQDRGAAAVRARISPPSIRMC